MRKLLSDRNFEPLPLDRVTKFFKLALLLCMVFSIPLILFNLKYSNYSNIISSFAILLNFLICYFLLKKEKFSLARSIGIIFSSLIIFYSCNHWGREIYSQPYFMVLLAVTPVLFRGDEKTKSFLHLFLILFLLGISEYFNYQIFAKIKPTDLEARFQNGLAIIVAAVIITWEVHYYISLVRDYSQSLSLSEERFKLACEGNSAGVFDWDMITDQMICSDHMVKMLNLNSKQINARILIDLVSEEDQLSFQNNLKRHFRSGQRFECEFRIKCPIATPEKWVRISGQSVFRSYIPIRMCGILTEISEYKAQEIQQEHQKILAMNAAKLAALGEMAGGIAHEVSNPLAIIQGYTDRLKNQLGEDGQVKPGEAIKILERMQISIGRIIKIIQSMQKLAKVDECQGFEVCPFTTIVEDVLDIFSTRLNQSAVRLIREFEDEELLVQCHSNEIAQLVMNLINNALDAIENQKSSLSWIRVSIRGDQERIYFIVEDSGPGIPQEIRGKILLPFFTTKPVGKGTGLGLSIAASIATQHNGSLSLNSESKNTQFVLSIPRYHEKNVFQANAI